MMIIFLSVFADGCTFIKGFPNEYKQVLLNLVQNARDAIDDCIDEMPEDGVIEVGVEEGEDIVKIYVKDNGWAYRKTLRRGFSNLISPQRKRGGGQVSGFICQRLS